MYSISLWPLNYEKRIVNFFLLLHYEFNRFIAKHTHNFCGVFHHFIKFSPTLLLYFKFSMVLILLSSIPDFNYFHCYSVLKYCHHCTMYMNVKIRKKMSIMGNICIQRKQQYLNQTAHLNKPVRKHGY